MKLVSFFKKNKSVVCSAVFCAGLLALVVYLYLPTLGAYTFRDWDESIYAQVARESSPFEFTWLGQGADYPRNLWFEKPPLVIWLVQASFYIFGVSEFAARLPVLVFGVLTVLVVGLWAWRASGHMRAGAFAALSVFVCFHFLRALGVLNYDIPVGFFVVLSVFAYSQTLRSRKYWHVFWIGLALGMLTKSVIGLLPLPIIGVHILLTGRWRAVFCESSFWYGLGFFLLLSVPWHVFESFRYGGAFWRVYLFSHVFARFSQPNELNGGPWWYYFLIFQQLPFAFLALLGLFYGVVRIIKKELVYVLPIFGLVLPFILFSMSKTKGVNYIVVVYPFVAVLIGLAAHWFIDIVRGKLMQHIVVGVIATTMLYSGISYNAYRVISMGSPVYSDIREVGQWLKRKELRPILYVPYVSTTVVIAGQPLLVYYTGQPVAQAFPDPGLTLEHAVYRTRTHAVYTKDSSYYVVAVRYIP